MRERRTGVSLFFALLAAGLGMAVDSMTALGNWVAVGVVLAVGLLGPRVYRRLTAE